MSRTIKIFVVSSQNAISRHTFNLEFLHFPINSQISCSKDQDLTLTVNSLQFLLYVVLRIVRNKGTSVCVSDCTLHEHRVQHSCSCSLTAGKRLQNGTHFELWPKTSGPLPGIVVVRGAGTAAGMALRVQPQRTAFVFFHCKSSTRWNGSETQTFVKKKKKKKESATHVENLSSENCNVFIFKCKPRQKTDDKFVTS